MGKRGTYRLNRLDRPGDRGNWGDVGDWSNLGDDVSYIHDTYIQYKSAMVKEKRHSDRLVAKESTIKKKA